MEKINNNNKKVIFDPVYYTDVVEQTEMVFTHAQDILPKIDFKWAIVNYMKSEWRKNIEKGRPHEISEWGDMVLLILFKDKNYPKTDLIADDWWRRTSWMAEIYNRLSYKYDIPFAELADVVTFDYMMWRFVCGHEESSEHVVDSIYEQFYNKDGSINYDMVEKTNKKSDWWKDSSQ